MKTYLLVELGYGVLGTILERSHFCLFNFYCDGSSQRAVWMTMGRGMRMQLESWQAETNLAHSRDYMTYSATYEAQRTS